MIRPLILALLLVSPAAAQPLQAVVTSRVVHKGQTIAAADLRLVDVRNPRPVSRPVARRLADAVGLTAKRTLLPRRYIALDALRQPHAVRAGERATLRFVADNLSIVMPVTVLEDGGIGDSVNVRPAGSTRALAAAVMAAGTVELR